MQENDGKIQTELIFLVVIITIVLALAVALSNFTYAQEIQVDKKTLYRLAKQTSTGQENITAGITVGNGPIDIGVVQDKVYVANYVDGIVSVIDIKKNAKVGDDIKVGSGPVAIGVTPSKVAIGDTPINFVTSSKLYVANKFDNTVSVIDGRNNTNIKNIPVGGGPTAIGVGLPTVYVADSDNNTVSVIDGRNNTNIKNIPVGNGPIAIGIDRVFDLVYVANEFDNTVSVIDGRNNTNIKNIPVGRGPTAISMGIAVPFKAYIANEENNTVSEINRQAGYDKWKIQNIPVGRGPTAIGVLRADLMADIVYVANYVDGTVSVIDGVTDSKIGPDIPVGRGPVAIGIDRIRDIVYVANQIDNTVSVIDGRKNIKIGDDIPVGKEPIAIGIDEDPNTDTVYVANSMDDTLSVIDQAANKTVVGVTFNISPANAGHIECDKDKKLFAPLAQQFYLWSGSTCTAIPNQGFEFVSWQKNPNRNSSQLIQVSPPSQFFDSVLDFFLHLSPSKSQATLATTKFGNYTTNFRAIPPPIPPEYVATLFGTIATAFIGTWLTPTIIAWRKSRKQRGKVQRHYVVIKSVYDDGKVDEKDISRLDKLKDVIMDDYINGNISEQHYNNLNNKTSVLYEEIYKKKIDLLNGKDLDKVKGEINDSYAKGKISEQHYKLLNEKINKPSHLQQRISAYQPQVTSNDFVQSVKTYENSQLGIKMKYPAEWKLYQKEHYPDHPSDRWNQVVGFSSDHEIRTNSNLENVAIYVKSLQDKNISIDTYSYKHIDYIRKKFSIIETIPIMLAKSPGYKVLYTNTMGYDTIEVWTIQGNNVYTIKCTTKAHDHSLYLPIFEEIISSFQITKV
jgi:YVTN family beta-propeller protein